MVYLNREIMINNVLGTIILLIMSGMLGSCADPNSVENMLIPDPDSWEEYMLENINEELRIEWEGCNRKNQPTITTLNDQYYINIPIGGDKGCDDRTLINTYCKTGSIKDGVSFTCTVPSGKELHREEVR